MMRNLCIGHGATPEENRVLTLRRRSGSAPVNALPGGAFATRGAA